MNYTMKAHPTRYGYVLFRSRLEATWAAFFDLAGWKWQYEPVDLEIYVQGKKRWWTPDFIVEIPCGHSECCGRHTLHCEVKPYSSLYEFKGHVVDQLRYSPIGAKLGLGPLVSEFEMSHGGGGGIYGVADWVRDFEDLWDMARNSTRYKRAEYV